MMASNVRRRHGPNAALQLKLERSQWDERAKRATEQIAQLTARTQETREAIARPAGQPQILADKRRTLIDLAARSGD